MTTFNNEFEGLPGTGFTPFDDSGESRHYAVQAVSEQSGSGMDTSAFDAYRQGVELTLAKYLYGTNQPKIWVGNLTHQNKEVTYGQPRNWTEFSGNPAHNDQVIEFDPTLYITDPDFYPTPVWFNDGPQESEECVIEPLTIPFRRSPQEGPYPAHMVRGSVEQGNQVLGPLGGTGGLQQFIEYSLPLTPSFFFDDGQEYIGTSAPSDSIVVPGFVSSNLRQEEAFVDTNDEMIVSQISVGSGGDSANFLSLLKNLHVELDEDVRETYTQKSATAGFDVYGENQARYGTDSIAFVGHLLGS